MSTTEDLGQGTCGLFPHIRDSDNLRVITDLKRLRVALRNRTGSDDRESCFLHFGHLASVAVAALIESAMKST